MMSAPAEGAELGMRVVTWNVWWRFGPWEQRREAILSVLGGLRPDVVGLQEGWARGEENLAAWLAERLGMDLTRAASDGAGKGPKRIGGGPVAIWKPGIRRRAILERAIAGQILVDAWEYADPAAPSATWDSTNPFVARTFEPNVRCDYIHVGLPGPDGLGRVCSVRRAGDAPVGGVWPSDHTAVVADLA